MAGCTEAEIATITVHSLAGVGTMLDRHYLSRDAGMAESAMAKLEKHQAGTKQVNLKVNRSGDQGDDAAQVIDFDWWRGGDSNPRPCDYESHALTN